MTRCAHCGSEIQQTVDGVWIDANNAIGHLCARRSLGHEPTSDPRSWLREILNARPTDEGPGVYALACLLRDDEGTPPALRAIAAAFTRTRISDRPRARSGDPSTSRVAAENVPVQRRPGGSFHRILKAYAHARDRDAAIVPADGPGYTAREVEETWSIREAHKRTSDLLRDGLLEVVLDDDGRDVVRDGGRVLAITPAGREELGRMERATRQE